LALVAIAGALIAAGSIVAVDPDVPFAIGVVIAAVAVSAGAIAAVLMLSIPLGESRRRQRPAASALRRGIEVTAIVGLLLLLRVVDGLTVITGGFIVAGFLVAEAILSARPSRASR
jgi:hypothetical protein